VVPRLVLQLGREWGDTVLELPAGLWCNVLTDDELPGGPVRVGELLARFPVGLLSQEETTS
jgi:maltooligosyltrehalose synthase